MAFLQDCSNEALLKLQQYLTKKDIIIQSIEEHKGLDNKEFGDLKITGFSVNDKPIQLNVDFKKQEKDRPFIPIELIYVKANGSFDGWLYNNNEDFIIYEFKDGSVYIFEHLDLIRLAKFYNSDKVWNTCLVYNYNPSRYEQERKWITEQLDKYDVAPFGIRGQISSDKIHINGAFNYTYTGKVHSGFCLNLPLEYVKFFQAASRTIIS